VHADEFVIKKESRQKIERRNPGLLSEMNATGQLPGTRPAVLVMPFPVNASMTKVMTMAEAMSKVMAPGSFGNWPSSPSAQRGDSGVWRKVVALIKSTGPMSGSSGTPTAPATRCGTEAAGPSTGWATTRTGWPHSSPRSARSS
jgi:hypothetical protein